MRWLVCIALLWWYSSYTTYSFKGTHYIAQYYGCTTALKNPWLCGIIITACKASGATVLRYNQHTFDTGGKTALVLLSESHASIHTYPEYNACFVDLFTCGDTCKWESFENIMVEYLQPAQIERKIVVRE